MGLLAGGVLANSLLLVYLAIGAAALAAVMLTVGVVVWREEVFGESPAGQAGQASQAGQAARQAVGLSPVLAAAGASAAGRPAAGAADDVAPAGAAAPRGDLAAVPPHAALSQDPDRPERSPQQEHPDWLKHSDRPERSEPQRLAEPAAPAARLGSAVPGPPAPRSEARRGATPQAPAVRGPESGEAPAGDDIWPSADREPSAQGRRGAGVTSC